MHTVRQFSCAAERLFVLLSKKLILICRPHCSPCHPKLLQLMLQPAARFTFSYYFYYAFPA